MRSVATAGFACRIAVPPPGEPVLYHVAHLPASRDRVWKVITRSGKVRGSAAAAAVTARAIQQGFRRPMSIRIDPTTGLKIFRTRAAKATDRIAGKGYSVVEDEALRTLPPQPAGAVFDAEEQAKYREYKEARRGAADYMAMEGEFAKYLEDVYSADPVPREALDDECDIARGRRRLRGPPAVAQAPPRPASTTCVSARRAATSAARGTGTAIRASPVTSRATATCRCSRRWATSRR